MPLRGKFNAGAYAVFQTVVRNLAISVTNMPQIKYWRYGGKDRGVLCFRRMLRNPTRHEWITPDEIVPTGVHTLTEIRAFQRWWATQYDPDLVMQLLLNQPTFYFNGAPTPTPTKIRFPSISLDSYLLPYYSN